MSHLACADTPDHPKNASAVPDFAAFARSLPQTRRSLANSAGVFLGPDFRFDLVRPGIALYGGNPFAALANPDGARHPPSMAASRQVGEAEAGETIGYGGALHAQAPHALCHGVGRLCRRLFPPARLLRHAIGRARPISAIGRCQYLGRVSMDLIMFDVTDMPPELARRGGFVELIGPRFTVDNAAALAGTIAYEILTSLGPRYHRIYISETNETPQAGGSG